MNTVNLFENFSTNTKHVREMTGKMKTHFSNFSFTKSDEVEIFISMSAVYDL